MRPFHEPPPALSATRRVATWVGEPGAFAAASLCGPRLPTVSRHGLWLALQLGPDPLFHVPACVLDVRRPDERLAFGAIRGTLNVPGGPGEAWGIRAGAGRRRAGRDGVGRSLTCRVGRGGVVESEVFAYGGMEDKL